MNDVGTVEEDLIEAQCTPPTGRPPEVEALLELPDELKPPPSEVRQLRTLLGIATLAATTSSLYSTLRARGNQYGSYTRPRSRCSNPPPPGTLIRWTLCQPNQDNLRQKRELGWRNLGSIGNTDHLEGCGDHTGHSLGKQIGLVYADDTDDPPWLEEYLLRLCRMEDYDTRWLHFWNINGSQYNYAGQRVASSGDTHLHSSTREGFELVSHTLLLDADRLRQGLPLLRGNTDVATDLNPAQNFPFYENSWVLDYYASKPTITDGVTLRTWGPEGWAYSRRMVEESAVRHAEVTAKLAAIDGKLGGAEGEELQQIVRAELTALEGRLADRFVGLGGDIAARVTQEFGEDVGNFVASEFFEALQQGRAEVPQQ